MHALRSYGKVPWLSSDFLTMVMSMIYAVGFTLFGLVFYSTDVFINRTSQFSAGDVRP